MTETELPELGSAWMHKETGQVWSVEGIIIKPGDPDIVLKTGVRSRGTFCRERMTVARFRQLFRREKKRIR